MESASLIERSKTQYIVGLKMSNGLHLFLRGNGAAPFFTTEYDQATVLPTSGAARDMIVNSGLAPTAGESFEVLEIITHTSVLVHKP